MCICEEYVKRIWHGTENYLELELRCLCQHSLPLCFMCTEAITSNVCYAWQTNLGGGAYGRNVGSMNFRTLKMI